MDVEHSASWALTKTVGGAKIDDSPRASAARELNREMNMVSTLHWLQVASLLWVGTSCVVAVVQATYLL